MATADEEWTAEQAVAKDELLEGILEANGISKDEFLANRHSITFLEAFLSWFHTLAPMIWFPGLVELQVIHCELKSIEGLDNCTHLERLWLNENAITKISGLEKCTNLTQLYLYSNQISRIEGLEALTKLEVLWLQENKIKHIEGLDTLVNLRNLSLAANRIELVGSSLDKNVAIEELNLAGNRIGSFRDIPPLDTLPKLRSLYFMDPHFGNNPICELCNYQTYALYHLYRITKLDSLLITQDQRHLSETTFMKKKMYYNMRIKTLRRNTTNLLRKAHQFRNSKINEVATGLNALIKTLKLLEKEVEDKKVGAEPDADPSGVLQEIAELQAQIGTHIRSKEALIADMEARYEEMKGMITQIQKHNISRLLVELQTGGNVRLEEGQPGDVWFKSCVDLVKSRFFAADFEKYGMKEIKTTKVIRIHNRFLRNRFENRLRDVVDTSDQSYKKSLEYLFYGEDVDIPGELLHALEHGFHPSGYHQELSKDEGIPLTNSVFLCDQARVMEMHKTRVVTGKELMCRLLITKVFLGKCCPEKDSTDRAGPLITPAQANVGPLIQQKDYTPGTTSVVRVKGSDSKQRVWFNFDRSMVLPEYLIEYTYIPTAPAILVKNIHLSQDVEELHQIIHKLLPVRSEMDAMDMRSLAYMFVGYMQYCNRLATNNGDTSEVTQTPLIKSRNLYSELTESVIQEFTGTEPADVKCLFIIGNFLKRVDILAMMLNLTALNLSFNELTKMDTFVDLPNLELLDLSFNAIKRVDGLKGMPKLTTLHLNNNALYRLEDINILKRGVPQLTYLDLSHNALCDIKSYKFVILRRLINLTSLDGKPITEEDKNNANDKLVCISNETILKHGKVGGSVGWLTSLAPLTAVSDDAEDEAWNGPHGICTGVSAMSLLGPGGLLADEAQLEVVLKQIVELRLSGMRLRRIQGMEKLASLQRLSLSDNEISRIEGLDNCTNLEELSLEDNRLLKIEGLSSLVNLHKLELGKNKIVRFEGLEALTQLCQLSIEENDLLSLAGLSSCQNLLELYVGNNRLDNSKDVMLLKVCPRLIILDVSGNPMCREPEFRLFSIFNLKKLKVLDGVSIDTAECARARDTFQGKMTNELLVEKVGPQHSWEGLTDLNLSNCGIKELTLLEGFPNLVHIKLEHNLLVDVKGLTCCTKLQTINLSHNRIQHDQSGGLGQSLGACAKLHTLILEANGLQSIATLGLVNPSLTRLSLKNNEISKVDGLDALSALQELFLDKNKLRTFDDNSFTSVPNLRVLTLTENMIKNLDGMSALVRLKQLHLTANRISDILELDKMSLEGLQDINLTGNAACRKNAYRLTLVFKIPTLELIDGREVKVEEKERAHNLFSPEVQAQYGIPPNVVTAPIPMSVSLGHHVFQQGTYRQPGVKPVSMEYGSQQMQPDPNTGLLAAQRVVPKMRQPPTLNPARNVRDSRDSAKRKPNAGPAGNNSIRPQAQYTLPRPPSGSANNRLPRV